MAGKRRKGKTKRPGPITAEAIARLHGVGLLRGIAGAQGAAIDATDTELAGVTLSFEGRKLFEREHPDLVVHAPDEASQLVRRAGGVIGDGRRVVVEDVGPRNRRLARVTVDGQATTYAWTTSSELVGIVNEALSQAGDPRRFVLLQEEYENETYLLATPEQRAALDSFGLLSTGSDVPALPRPLIQETMVFARSQGDGRARTAVCRLGEPTPHSGTSDSPITQAFPCRPGLALVVLDGADADASERALAALVADLAEGAPAPADGRAWLEQRVTRVQAAAGAVAIGLVVMLGTRAMIARAGAVRILLRRARPSETAWSMRDVMPVADIDELDLTENHAFVLASDQLHQVIPREVTERILTREPPHLWNALLAHEAAERSQDSMAWLVALMLAGEP